MYNTQKGSLPVMLKGNVTILFYICTRVFGLKPCCWVRKEAKYYATQHLLTHAYYDPDKQQGDRGGAQRALTGYRRRPPPSLRLPESKNTKDKAQYHKNDQDDQNAKSEK